jgi:glycosyltransferase involved in cell wall biosynthesis
MHILMVLSTKTFPPDGRVEREARALIKAGHSVSLMARRGLNQPRMETFDHIRVIRVPLPGQTKKAISDFLYFFWQRYFLFFHLIRFCRKYGVDAIHVHDLPYAVASVCVGKLLGIPVVFDMHEHYTVMLRMSFESRVYRKFKPFAFLLLSLLNLEERLACRWSCQVIVVAREHIPRIQSLGVPRGRILELTNTEELDIFGGFPIQEAIVRQYANDFVILYTGGFSPHRGLETAIRAMPSVLKELPTAKLVLVGEGSIRAELEELTKQLHLTNQVQFTGHQSFSLLPSYIQASAICLIPHISTAHIETTMPNKIFQFMMLGKPVLVSSTGPMMRIVKETECGLIFQERNVQSLSLQILAMRDKQQRLRWGRNGKTAVRQRYHWGETVKDLVQLYESKFQDRCSAR